MAITRGLCACGYTISCRCLQNTYITGTVKKIQNKTEKQKNNGLLIEGALYNHYYVLSVLEILTSCVMLSTSDVTQK